MKFSDKLIAHLRENRQLKRFRQEYRSLYDKNADSRAYGNTIAGCMEIAQRLDEEQIPYCVLGGLAVAFYQHQIDHEAFLIARRTSDIDLLVERKAVEGILREEGYEFSQVRRGMKGAKAGVFDFTRISNGEHLVVGLRESVEDRKGRDITNKVLQHAGTVDVYSIPIRIPTIRELIAMKRFANRTKDREDIRLLKKLFRGLKL